MAIPPSARLPHEYHVAWRIGAYWLCAGILAAILDRDFNLLSWQALAFFVLGTPLVAFGLGATVTLLRRGLSRLVLDRSPELEFSAESVFRLRITGMLLNVCDLLLVILTAAAVWNVLHIR